MKMVIDGEPPLTSDLSATKRTFSRRKSPAPSGLRIKTILVPLDFSGASMKALRYTIRFAESFGAAIHLVHVQPTDELTAIAQAGHMMLDAADAVALMQDRLAEIQERHNVKFWPDNCHVLSGRPYEEICKLASEIEADLIALPTRGYSGLKHVLLGSTAERTVRFAPCPVLVLRGAKYEVANVGEGEKKAEFKPRTILVPVDFSRCSLTGAKYAARLARRTGATVRFLHVVYPYTLVFPTDRMSADTTPLVQRATEAAKVEMAKLKGIKFLRGVTCEAGVRVGRTVDEIASESGRPGVDLLVTSTHGRNGFQRALLGSVAEHVVRYSECPIITVPSRGRF